MNGGELFDRKFRTDWINEMDFFSIKSFATADDDVVERCCWPILDDDDDDKRPDDFVDDNLFTFLFIIPSSSSLSLSIGSFNQKDRIIERGSERESGAKRKIFGSLTNEKKPSFRQIKYGFFCIYA